MKAERLQEAPSIFVPELGNLGGGYRVKCFSITSVTQDVSFFA